MFFWKKGIAALELMVLDLTSIKLTYQSGVLYFG
jgi:hypothetical protein